MSRIGVITNPRSRANKGNPRLHARLDEAMGDAGELAAPDGDGELQEQLNRWRADGVSTIAINGGDGTVHRVATALAETWADADWPTLAVLPGGTMNIIASSIGVKGRPHHVLRRLIEAEGDVDTVPVWTLEVTGSEGTVQGFLFGNGIVARFLEVYYEGSDPSPAKAAWILGRGAASALVGGKYIRRLTRPFAGTLTADGEPVGASEWTAIAVGTVEQLGLGFRAFHLAPRNPGKMHLQAIGGSVVDLARDLPRIYRGIAPGRPGNSERVATELVIRGEEPFGYMVDGDFYRTNDEVRLSIGHRVEMARP